MSLTRNGQPAPSRRRSRLLFHLIVYVTIVVTVLLLLLPQIASQGLRYGLLSYGSGAVEVDNIDINLFQGTAGIDGLRLYRSAAQVMSLKHAEVEIDWGSLFERRVQLKRLRLEGLSLTVSQSPRSPLRVAGFPITGEEKPAQKETLGWGYGIEQLELADNRIQLIRPGLTQALIIERLTLGSLQSWNSATPTPLEAVLGLNDTTLHLNASATPLANNPGANIKLKLNALDLAIARPLLPRDLGTLNGELSADIELTLNREQGTLNIHQSGNLRLKRIDFVRSDRHLQLNTLTWGGQNRVTLGPQGYSTQLEGKLSGATLSLKLPALNLSLGGENAEWQGKLSIAQERGALKLSSKGEATLTGATIGEAASDTHHTTLQQLQLRGVTLQSAREFAIDGIELTDLQTAITLTEQGLDPLIRHLPEDDDSGATATDTTETSPTQPEPVAFRLGGVKLQGQNLIRFSDETVSPAFSQTLQPEAISVGAVDSRHPEAPTPVSVSARLGEHSRLSIEAQIQPLQTPLSLTLNAELQDYEMPPLSPYLIRQLGYKINSGQLDTTLEMSIRDNTLQGEAKLSARQLDLEAEDPQRIAEFEKKSSMPVNTALGLLRDKENKIQLKLPFSGKLNDPQFDISDAINTALAKTMRSAAVSYVKYLLQPYSSVITLVQLAGKAGGMRLEPIDFAPGSAEPEVDSAGYIERLATLFEQRENLQLRLCGIATTADIVATSQGKTEAIPPEGSEPLSQLAKARAESIKRILVQQYGLPPGQLYICHPELDREAEARPRVDLRL